MTVPRIAVATPVYGGAKHGQLPVAYTQALLHLVKERGVTPLEQIYYANTDLVRARSKALHMAQRAGFDLLLFWDADILASPQQIAACLDGMVRASAYADVVAVDYLRRGGSDLVARGKGEVVRRATVRLREAEHVPFGFALLTLHCMRSMTEFCLRMPGLRHKELVDGKLEIIATSFMLQHTKDDVLLEECFSFCERWRAMGGRCHLYEDVGSELGHLDAVVHARGM